MPVSLPFEKEEQKNTKKNENNKIVQNSRAPRLKKKLEVNSIEFRR